MGSLIMLVGLPGSGKSTCAEEMRKRNCIVISTDIIHGLFYSAGVRKSKRKISNFICNTINQSLLRGQDVVFDATNLTVKSRKKILKNINNAESIIAVFKNTSIEICKERNSQRNKIIPEKVIDKMAKKLTPPTLKEGFNYILTLN